MPTIRKRGDKWQVQVRRKNCPPQSKSFNLRADAVEWARNMEIRADRNDLQPLSLIHTENATIEEMLERYIEEVVSKKRSAENQEIIIRAYQRRPIAKKIALLATPQDFAADKTARLMEVSATTYVHQISIIQHAFDVAMMEWGWPFKENPLRRVKKPKVGKPRARRPSLEEMERLRVALSETRVTWLYPLILFAIETGMRRSEMLRLCWQDINFTARTAFIGITKNGYSRTIPLSTRAITILEKIKPEDAKPTDRVFPISDNAAKLAWQRLRDRAGIEDLET